MIKILLMIIFFFQTLQSEELKGKPKIIDGDTIHIKSYKIRLEGIDAPEMRQKCKRDSLKISTIISFSIKKEYFCGKESKKELKKKIGSKSVVCNSSGKDRYKRYLATCYIDKTNLNKWLVRNGHAVAYSRYSKIYIEDEKFAKENKLGIWAGTFKTPEKWRKLN